MHEINFDKKSVDQDKFDVKINGKVYKVRRAKYLSPRILNAFTIAAKNDDLVTICDTLAEPGTPLNDLLVDSPAEILQEFIEAWMKDSDMTMGNSSPS